MAKQGGGSGLGVLVLVLIAIGLAVSYWQVSLVIGAGAVGVGLIWWSRRTPDVVQEVSDVQPSPPAPIVRHLPEIPVPPAIPSRPERPSVEPALRPYASELCPYCSERMDPVPRAKTRCKMCRQPVFVRTGPDGMRYLLQEVDLPAMDAEWAAATGRDSVERDRLDTARAEVLAAQAWRVTIEAMPGVRLVDLSSDEDEQEVVGESHYQDALAEVSNLTDGVVARRDVVAVLVPEPNNPYDRNAIRVEVFGRLVGRIPKEDAPEMSPILLGLQRQGILLASRAGIVGGGVGRPGDRLSFGIWLQIHDHSDWVELLKGTVTVRSADSP